MADTIVGEAGSRLRRTRGRRTRERDNEDIVSVSQFVARIIKLREDGMPTAFRGQKNYAWKGMPTLYRPGEKLISHEHKMVRELISTHPQEFQRDTTMFDRLVRMQHYGLPTRLLDVTLNPLVALYFAAQDFWIEELQPDGTIIKKPSDGKVMTYKVPEYRNKYFDSDTVACLANLANLNYEEKREIESLSIPQDIKSYNSNDSILELVRYVSQEKPNFVANINPRSFYKPVFVRPKNNNRRIIAQAGAFLIHGLQSKDYKFHRSIVQNEIRIKADKKEDIREELSILGIDASTLFPELDKAAEIIAYRYKKNSSPLEL